MWQRKLVSIGGNLGSNNLQKIAPVIIGPPMPLMAIPQEQLRLKQEESAWEQGLRRAKEV